MPRAKPTLGYASRTDAVVALTEQGMSQTVIAERIGIPQSTVSALLNSALRRRDRQMDGVGVRPPAPGLCAVVLEVATLAALRPHAAKRGLTANTLARRLIETIAADGLVDGILDDAEAAP